MKLLYLFVDVFTVIIPLLFSFHPKIKFYKFWPPFFAAAFIVSIIFTCWDAFFTSIGVWRFNPRYITGVYLLNLPIEEVLFFICIPFSCVFTYYCLNKFYDLSWKKRTENIFSITLTLGLLAIGLIFFQRKYTSSTFISTAILLLFLRFSLRIDWFGKIMTVYGILLIPFFIVNGVLTGTGLHEPVVIYNNSENLGIRLLTIPIEDVVYGFNLILLNVFFFKLFGKKA